MYGCLSPPSYAPVVSINPSTNIWQKKKNRSTNIEIWLSHAFAGASMAQLGNGLHRETRRRVWLVCWGTSWLGWFWLG